MMRLRPVFLFLALTVFFVAAPALRAQDTDALQKQIDEHNAQIQALEQEISGYQQQLDATTKDRQTLQGAIKQLDLSRQKLSASITVTQNKIDTDDLEIRQLALQITDKSSRISANSAAIAEGLREVQEIDGGSLLEQILDSQKLSDLWDHVSTLSTFQGAVRAKTEELKALKSDLEDTKHRTEGKRAELIVLRAQLADQRRALDANRADKNKLLAETKNKESEYQKLIAQKQTLKAQFEAELSSIESKLKQTVDPASLPRYGSGVLSWPLDKVRITQYFGNTPFATANPQVYGGKGHNGIDLGAPPGTLVKAALSGTVLGTGDTDLTCPNASYGRWILIRHNNGLTTLYAHLSVITAAAGQSVATGQIIGYSGSTGYATGPHLHFTVYASDVVTISTFPSTSCKGRVYTMPISPADGYLNPLSYL